MTIFKIGSCRLLYDCASYSDCLHNSKEIIQLLKFINMSKEELEQIYTSQFIYCNNKFTDLNKFIEIITTTKKQIENANVILLEISSLKEVLFNNTIYLQYVRYIHYHKRHKSNSQFNDSNLQIKIQDYETLYNDLIIIKQYLNNKKIILIPHINSKTLENEYINNRKVICDVFNEFKQNFNDIYVFNPMNYLINDPQFIYEKINDLPDFEHYSKESRKIIKNQLIKFVNNIF